MLARSHREKNSMVGCEAQQHNAPNINIKMVRSQSLSGEGAKVKSRNARYKSDRTTLYLGCLLGFVKALISSLAISN